MVPLGIAIRASRFDLVEVFDGANATILAVGALNLNSKNILHLYPCVHLNGHNFLLWRYVLSR
jgi:hypothetical protein